MCYTINKFHAKSYMEIPTCHTKKKSVHRLHSALHARIVQVSPLQYIAIGISWCFGCGPWPRKGCCFRRHKPTTVRLLWATLHYRPNNDLRPTIIVSPLAQASLANDLDFIWDLDLYCRTDQVLASCESKALLSSFFIIIFGTVAFLFLSDKHCLIIE